MATSNGNGHRRGRPLSLQLVAFSDRELMLTVLDYADEHGYVDAEQIANAIGLDHSHATQCVGSRFSWLRRFGVMERDDENAKWRLTASGRKIALGELSKAEEAALKHLSPEKLMEATTVLAGRYRRVNDTAATMARRAWINGTANR